MKEKKAIQKEVLMLLVQVISLCFSAVITGKVKCLVTSNSRKVYPVSRSGGAFHEATSYFLPAVPAEHGKYCAKF